ncbi:MAG: LysM peptidoglycan-binding domain-containing protein [Caldilineaceae bacterium]|nr:LysM peptidoglycan-binding domain-containing protein [Caldilineaceae bacterium]
MAQQLVKAQIQSLVPNKPAFKVLFNPKEYRLSKSNQFSEVAIPGLSAPLLQFGRGDAQTLSMQLFFDTYDQPGITKVDVRTHTEKVTNLMKIDPHLHAPPVCQFSWSNLIFIGVLQQAELRCTLFAHNGVPVRATLDVTFKEFSNGSTETGMLQSADYTKQYIVRPGDTLSSIAAFEYEDPTKWRPIAEKNNIHNPLAIRAGQVLVIPAIE